MFPDSSGDSLSLVSGWFAAGLLIVGALLSAAICSWLAIGRGAAPGGWFLLGLVLNLPAIVVALGMLPRGSAGGSGVPRGFAKVPLTRPPMLCPGCGAAHHPSATRCGSCGSELAPRAPSEARGPGGAARRNS